MTSYYKFPKGKKTKEWDKAKRELKPSYEQAGITYCELGKYLYSQPEHREAIENNRHQFAIAWAHGDKRDNLVGYELYFLVVPACQDCHNYIEYRPDMREIVKAVIKARQAQPQIFLKYIKLHVLEGYNTDLLDL